VVANVKGKYYAVSDRCGHANAYRSRGSLNGTIITCPLHGAQFDVITGKNIKNFNLTIPSFDELPEDFQKFSKYALDLVGAIKTNDQRTYEVIIENDIVMINTTANRD
jgi:nitrite reductase/ring-hydroxylating ferredoxin subunit